MEPNFHHEQIVDVEPVTSVSDLKRGDVIVFEIDDAKSVKRLIGLPGEKVEIRDGKIYINDEQLDESSYNPSLMRFNANFEPVILGGDEFFVLGDNRDNSSDSRRFGPISGSSILQKVVP